MTWLVTILCGLVQFSVARDANLQQIPTEQRDAFVRTVEELTKAQLAEDWHTVYRFQLASLRRKLSEVEFVKREKRFARAEKIRSFELKDATPVTNVAEGQTSYEVAGCGTAFIRGKQKGYLLQTLATLKEQKWHFTPVGVKYSIDGPPEPCPYD